MAGNAVLIFLETMCPLRLTFLLQWFHSGIPRFGKSFLMRQFISYFYYKVKVSIDQPINQSLIKKNYICLSIPLNLNLKLVRFNYSIHSLTNPLNLPCYIFPSRSLLFSKFSPFLHISRIINHLSLIRTFFSKTKISYKEEKVNFRWRQI